MTELEAVFTAVLVVLAPETWTIEFPAQPLQVRETCAGRTEIVFDVDGDTRGDYRQLTDDRGRKIELRFAHGEGEMERIVRLDELDPKTLPHCILALDGVPFTLVANLYQEGRFRLFHPPSRVVTCFPGMTNPAFHQVFGGQTPIAYESSYFDRRRNRLVDGTEAYLRGEAPMWSRGLDYRSPSELDAVAYLRPDTVFRQELKDIAGVFAKAQQGTRTAYCVATAGLATRGGRTAILTYLRTIDSLCERIVYDHRGRVRISLVSDHGHSPSGKGRVSYARLLGERGYRLTNRLEQPNDVVTVEFGLVTCAVFYTAEPAGVASVLLTDPSVALACYPVASGRSSGEQVDVVVQSATGRAIVQKRGHGFSYHRQYGDPLELSGLIEKLREQGKIGRNGLIDDRAMLSASIDHRYPDPLWRIWEAFNGLVQEPADLIVCPKDGYVYGSPFFYNAIGGVASTHGSLDNTSSMTFAMTMMGSLPPIMRLTEVMSALKQLQEQK